VRIGDGAKAVRSVSGDRLMWTRLPLLAWYSMERTARPSMIAAAYGIVEYSIRRAGGRQLPLPGVDGVGVLDAAPV